MENKLENRFRKKNDKSTVVEQTAVENIKNKYELYKQKAEFEIEKLNVKNQILINKLAFYILDDLIRNDNLPEQIKTVYDLKNVDNTRFFDIIELRKQYESTLNENLIPVEVKFIIKELS